ncbi:iron-dicitrate transporter subunit, ATP-binding component of ABC superfamily [Streptomyces ambofaciens ATCC 23877]|uniref:Iron-dicitrate transporter subunit, ATP-binding component of ABC superfamily n=2 Tax=Streptomyces ambofaciens TaxID=1889 RepID=A3KHZ1_STRA7|nr:ABC transporter ATP-binding protein [Streptomyces ambofaciens]AKZ53429.1 iron-dicitrate transporter subunit, ATP-binding component of ABC superfamily [Streptomyces ambofaciens ATCC 23877]ANB04285.1 ABC transporter ATP-binding protein [Streptomyces ambofaciens]CAJ89318.1 putative iron transport protein, ATP-binding component [Streptomyces ambofaciens ATCC 23877]
MDLKLDELSVVTDGRSLVRGLSLAVPDGQVVGLVGPNGSGKSTALRCVYRALRPSSGTVWVGGQDLTRLPMRHSARTIAAMTQDGGVDFDFTVEEVVALGRAPHLRGNQALSGGERELCERAMEQLDIGHLAHRGVMTLSGGERQRVLLARALVQEPEILVLDEPTNHLDVRHQVDLLSLLRASGLTVLVVLHDLNLAAAACDRLGVLSRGRLVASGTPAEVLTRELVGDVFGVSASVVPHPLTGDPQLLYSLNSTR